MTLKAAGFTAVQHVGSGMFAWRDLEMPVEGDPALVNMPPAEGKRKEIEQTLLERLGYDSSSGKPKSNC